MIPLRILAWLSALAWLLLAAPSCITDPSSPGNVIAGRRPAKTVAVARADLLTDGTAAYAGDDWRTDLTAVFGSTNAFVEFDLGASHALSAGLLVGDHNDEYVVALSEHGVSFEPWWVVPMRLENGQRPRSVTDLQGRGRYVRVWPQRGDGRFGVSELQLFSERPLVFPPQIPLRRGLEMGEAVRAAVLVFAASLLLVLLASAPFFRRAVAAAALLPALMAGYRLVSVASSTWPLGPLDISLIRAATAAVAAIAVWSSIFVTARFRPSKGPLFGVLWLSAVVALATFFNMGQPQFVDRSTGAPSFIHNYDMRVYFPIAKYFEELGFDGTYLASVAAFADDDAGASLTSLGPTPLRDLDTLRMTRVSDVEGKIRAVQQRFSPARWEEFKRDMRYFRQSMGVQDYLSSLTDHGGNATPVWLTFARLLFFRASANSVTLLVTALLDPLLLVLMFVAIFRAYGARTTLVAMVVFGANDFYMFGTNWVGATLRHDWIAYLGIGIAALKLERWAAAGALLALAAMIRAFPALALFGAVVPMGWAAWEARDGGGARAFVTSLVKRRDFVRLVAAAATCVVVGLLVSSSVFSFGAWGAWLAKVAKLDHDPASNETSLRVLIAGAGGDQQAILLALWPVYALSLALPSLALIWASRGRRPDQIAALALLLVPLVFNPANYYLHFICLLPVISDDLGSSSEGKPWMTAPDATRWLLLLGVCVAQYWTVLERDETLHFRFATVLYFAVVLHLLFNMLRQNAQRAESPIVAAEPT